MTAPLFGFTNWGPDAGGCGHRHRTADAARACAMKARTAFVASGLRYDRTPLPVVRGEPVPLEPAPHRPTSTLQEGLLADAPHGEWKMLVGCVLLNRTRGVAAAPVVHELLERWPAPEFLAVAGPELEELLRPLGLWRQRAATLRRLSSWWFRSGWDRRKRWLPASGERLLEVGGLGKYAADSYRIFVLGDLTVDTDDPILRAALRRLGVPITV